MSRSRLKQLRSIMWVGAVLFAVMIAARADAQYSMPQVPGFSNYYPWFNDVPQYRGNQSFRWFLANHPNIARTLSRNPGLLYNASWRRQHPELEQYLSNHPYVWQALNNQYWCTGPAETQWGDYDNQHQWRDAYWWHQNSPDQFYNNHPNWASLNSRWRDHDGAYDQQHVWHYGQWWYNKDPNWVNTHHPDWVKQHQNWTRQATQQENQQRQAVREQQQRNVQQQQASQAQERQNRQHEAQRQNQANQRENQQRQAEHEQQQRKVQQQEAAHQHDQRNQQRQPERTQKQEPQHATTHQEHQQRSKAEQPHQQHGNSNDKP
jgi:hypothetical protein